MCDNKKKEREKTNPLQRISESLTKNPKGKKRFLRNKRKKKEVKILEHFRKRQRYGIVIRLRSSKFDNHQVKRNMKKRRRNYCRSLHYQHGIQLVSIRYNSQIIISFLSMVYSA